MDERKPKEAEEEFEKAILLDSQCAEAYHGLGLAFGRQSAWDKAIAAFKKALELDPNRALFHYNLGKIYERKDDDDAAIQAYGEAIRLQPGFVEAHDSLGVVLARNNDYESAEREFRKAIMLKPDCALAFFNLGGVLIERGEPREAIKAYEKAIGLGLRDDDIYCNLGDAQADCGLLVEALASYTLALRSYNPRSSRSYRGLGRLYFKMEKYPDAVVHFKKALEISPNSADILCDLGGAAAANGDLASAVSYYEQALKHNPACSLVYANLASVYAKQGNVDKVRELIKRADANGAGQDIEPGLRAKTARAAGDL